MTIQPIAHIHTDFPDKFGIPRQSNLVRSLRGEIHFTKDYRNPDYLRGIEDYSHLWLIWEFSANKHPATSPTVRPPRLGGNVRMGVFATRSPYRPNPLGLSCVRLEKVDWNHEEGPILHVLGADLLDQTPIYDIKPYLAFADSHPEAKEGFAGPVFGEKVKISYEEGLLDPLPAELRKSLLEILQQDPRPSYQDDPQRIYGMTYANYDIHFRVEDGTLYLLNLVSLR